MKKKDLKKDLGLLYKTSAKEVVTVDVPAMNFFLVNGEGAPDSVQYGEAVESLYALAYTCKFILKKGSQAIDYGVMPLEGLWWVDDMTRFSTDRKDEWKWTSMIMQPEYVTQSLFEEAVALVRTKKNPAALDKIRFESFTEGKAAQIMHIGPFSEEGPTIERVHDYIAELGLERIGKHHEIYLSDIRRAAPEKWRTIVRQPMG